jgi:hypothetical protein
MSEMKKVLDHETGRVSRMPAAEVTGMVPHGDVWVEGFVWDFGNGPEHLPNPLDRLAVSLCAYNHPFGMPDVMWLEFDEYGFAVLSAEALGLDDEVVWMEDCLPEGAEGGPTWRVCFGRDRLPEVYRRFYSSPASKPPTPEEEARWEKELFEDEPD